MCLALTVLACTFADAGQAQIRGFETLDIAVRVLVEELVGEGELEGKRVFAGADDFFDEETGLRLPLSNLLSRKCGTVLRENGARVPMSESEAVWVLHGRWRRYSEEQLHLTLFIAEPVEGGEPVMSAGKEALVPVRAIRKADLRPIIEQWVRVLVLRLGEECA